MKLFFLIEALWQSLVKYNVTILAGRGAGHDDDALLPEGTIYLDGNSLGVLPRSVLGRVQAAVEWEWGETLIKSWNEHGWFQLPQRIGRRLERLIGAEPGSVIVGDTISVNLGERGRFRRGLHLQVSQWRSRCAGLSSCAAGLAGRGAACTRRLVRPCEALCL